MVTPHGDDPTKDPVEQAREVVGLYGDPDTHWGFGLEATFSRPMDLSGSRDRLEALVAQFPHLGAAPTIEVHPPEAWAHMREERASTPFGEDGHLARVAVSEDSRTVYVAAHHGIVDGLGTLAIAEAVSGHPLRSHAQGIGDRRSSRDFWRSSALRLWEALVSPPARFAGTTSAEVPGQADHVIVTTMGARGLGSARMASAIARAYSRWPQRVGGRRVLISLGASRREQGVSQPDRQTAYFRIPLQPGAGVDEVRQVMEATEPEPDFPETSAGGVGPAVLRLLRNRLGCTVLLSNLGVVTGEHLESVTIISTLNGPFAVGLGVTSTDTTTTVSLRTRRSEFTRAETEELLALILRTVEA